MLGCGSHPIIFVSNLSWKESPPIHPVIFVGNFRVISCNFLFIFSLYFSVYLNRSFCLFNFLDKMSYCRVSLWPLRKSLFVQAPY